MFNKPVKGYLPFPLQSFPEFFSAARSTSVGGASKVSRQPCTQLATVLCSILHFPLKSSNPQPWSPGVSNLMWSPVFCSYSAALKTAGTWNLDYQGKRVSPGTLLPPVRWLKWSSPSGSWQLSSPATKLLQICSTSAALPAVLHPFNPLQMQK